MLNNPAGDPTPKEEITGEELFLHLAKILVGRILQADALCNTTDVEARLVSIISERDQLRIYQKLEQLDKVTDHEKLEAIEALIRGEFDHPSLVKCGELYLDRTTNILMILDK